MIRAYVEFKFGVVSYNYPPCNQGMPNVFTSVAHFLENGWIQANSNYDPTADFWCKDNCDHHNHCEEEDDSEEETTAGPNPTTPNPTTQSDDDNSDSSGTIESEHPYRSSRDDRWTLKPPTGKKVKMSFSGFQTEAMWDGVAVICDDYTYAFSGNNDHVPRSNDKNVGSHIVKKRLKTRRKLKN